MNIPLFNFLFVLETPRCEDEDVTCDAEAGEKCQDYEDRPAECVCREGFMEQDDGSCKGNVVHIFPSFVYILYFLARFLCTFLTNKISNHEAHTVDQNSRGACSK